MTYDFFNTSYLAFGAKITRAFKSLAQLFDNSNANYASIREQLAYIGKFIGRNYAVQTPNEISKPCNCDMIYKVLAKNKISNIYITTITDDSNNIDGIHLSLNCINPKTNKPTKLEGDIRELRATVYARLSTRNNNFSGTIYYDSLDTEDDDKNYNYSTNVNGNLIRLFTYEYNKDESTILLYDINEDINITSSGYNRKYSSMSVVDRTSQLLNNEIKGRKMLLVVTPMTSGDVSVNVKFAGNANATQVGQLIQSSGGHTGRFCFPLYLNDGDVITGGDIERIYEVIYA